MKLFHKNEIRQARPSLRLAAPLTYKISLGFGLLNIGIATALFQQPDFGGLVIERGVFTTTFWAWVFLTMATGVFVGLFINSWRLTRWFLMVGLLVKSLFMYALIDLGLRSGFSVVLGVLILWMFLTWVQFWTVVYFLPIPHADRGE